MKNLPLTIIVLTNRSGSLFEKCLASTQFASEVIIIDNNSQNNWLELAGQYHFKILEFKKRISNFSEVRNWAMKSSKNEWVFFLDSDEVLADGMSDILNNLVTQDLYDGVYVWRSDIFRGQKLKYGEAGRQRLLRFFKKDFTIFNRAIHEVAKVSGRVGQSDIEIEHYSHTSTSDFLSQVFGYSFEIGQGYRRKKTTLIFEMIIFPPAKFFFNFVVKLGFLDGFRGLTYAIIMSLHSLVVRVSAFEKFYGQQFKSN